jgi:carbon monoxide dehydrogenase subunit G
MEFENEFTVPVPPARAWAALMDMDQVAMCMPGATLVENDGDRFAGKVKVKVGPITVSYKGSAEFVEKDEDAGRAVLRAKGREERGAGTAGMTVVAQLESAGESATKVKVLTDLDITGKPAQFGRGVMSEVGTAIIGQFADRLATQLTTDESAPTADTDPARADEPRAGRSPEPDAAALDLGALVWAPAAKRALPVLGGALALLCLVAAVRGTRSRPTVLVVLTGAGDPRTALVTAVNPV